MTIAFGSIGAKSAGGTTTVSIAYPTVSADVLAIAARCAWLSTATFTDESGWTPGPSGNSGTGSSNDAHTTNIRGDHKILTGSESGSVTFDQGGTVGGCIGQMAGYTKTLDNWEVFNGGFGGDATHGTNRSATVANQFTRLKSGDMVLALVAVDTDTDLAGFGTFAFTHAGSSTGFGTATARSTGAGVTTGNDGNVYLVDCPYTGSDQSGFLGLTFNTTTSQCGPIAFYILHEFSYPALASNTFYASDTARSNPGTAAIEKAIDRTTEPGNTSAVHSHSTAGAATFATYRTGQAHTSATWPTTGWNVGVRLGFSFGTSVTVTLKLRRSAADGSGYQQGEVTLGSGLQGSGTYEFTNVTWSSVNDGPASIAADDTIVLEIVRSAGVGTLDVYYDDTRTYVHNAGLTAPGGGTSRPAMSRRALQAVNRSVL